MIGIPLFTILCFVLCLCGRKASETNVDTTDDDPDIFRNVSELITSKGYPVEEHCVQTADGYLLSVLRMPPGSDRNLDADGNEVVLLIHGVLADASNWVLNFPKQSLGFVLFDAGYDVWLLNTRGCTYSRKHIKYTTKEYKFWDYSFDEIAHYDVPDTIDYILKYTGKDGLYVIGHSQGTSAVFAMLSDRPDYNDKVKLFIAVSPVAFVGYCTTGARDLVPFADEIMFLTRILSSGEFLPSNYFTKKFREFCRSEDQAFCENLFFSFAGPDSSQLNKTRFGVYVAHYPSSSSTKSLVHYVQMVKSMKFRKFDYGRRRNLECYNQEDPPDYDLSRVRAPVALFWSTNDTISDAEDVELLRRQLNCLVFDYCVLYPYNHCDFLLALNAPQLVNKPILALLSQY